MRLINTKTLALEEFYGDIPPYAILSHRWESEEVTFKDYPTHTDPENPSPMKGWKKIRYCIDQAKQDGLGYCWVDTCCIDKSSSAELSEAINSMYAWYRDSSACYIYMSDVDSSYPPTLSLLSDETMEERAQVRKHLDQFKSSQWFSRGWTLQELLAPRKRVFYNNLWETILNLDNPSQLNPLRSLVSEVTGIPHEALRDFDSRSVEYSVATKMSWASNRKTTRIEDIAYCLMGLFDINMPLLYGEGHKAFLRLQHEIIRKSNDHSIFCWRDQSATFSTHRGLLARSPNEFDGSSEVVDFRRDLKQNIDLSLVTEHKEDEPFILTNRGLQITLPLASIALFPLKLYWRGDQEDGREKWRVAHGDFFARLNCKFSKKVGLKSYDDCYLTLTHLGNGSFARVDVDSWTSSQWLNFDLVSGAVGLWTTRQIFVQDNLEIPPLYTSPRIQRALFISKPPVRNLRVVAVEPYHPGDRDESSTPWYGPQPAIYLSPDIPTMTVTLDFHFNSTLRRPAHIKFLMKWVDESEPASKQDYGPRRWKLDTKFSGSDPSDTYLYPRIYPKKGFADLLIDKTEVEGLKEFTRFIQSEQVSTLCQDELVVKVKFFRNEELP